MALKKSEKMMVGYGLIAGGIAIVVGLGLPQLDAFNASNTQVNDMNQQIKDLAVQKETLTAQIALLEKNTDIPPGIDIRTYTADNKEQTIKEMLDGVVSLATEAGNRFISLTPADADPVIPSPAPTADKGKDAAATGTAQSSAADADSDKKQSALPPPIMSTFGYDLAIRGTYDSIQNFLKAMDGQKELLEISGIRLENEAGNDQVNSSGERITDPSAPIRLTAKLRLAMQPVGP